MKERAILFSGEMVKAIRGDKKTKTRRVIKPQPWPHPETGDLWLGEHRLEDVLADRVGACKYLPGDRLWVRETIRPKEETAANGKPRGIWAYYAADNAPCPGNYPIYKTVSPIHMPRELSRITLEIVSVRVERLQEISDADALAEGVDRTNTSIPGYARERFALLWNKINGKKAPWASNPYVWVIEFRRVKE